MRHVLLSASISVFAWALAFGQTAESVAFEVASVKPSAPPERGAFFGPARGGPGTPDPGQITWTYATLKSLLMTAYDVKTYQISGPAWLDTERYDIVAKVPAGATKEQGTVMWQNLLAERFGVTLHHESREFQVAELVIAKGGPKLKESTEDPNASLPGPPKFDKSGELSGPGMVTMIMAGANGPSAHTVAKAQPLSKLTTMLGNQMKRPVLDKTGLTGNYDFSLDFMPDVGRIPLPPSAVGPNDSASEPASSLAAAVQQQLGLRLVAGKAKLDVVVIDKVEKVPTEN
jgi:uncharacterized protein (TIGR03435 family)